MRKEWLPLCIAWVVFLGACQAATITPPDGVDAGMVVGETPREFFDANVAPLLGRCAGCHAPGGSAGEPFVDSTTPDTLYETVLTYPRLVDPGSPDTSRIVIKGDHSPGVAWEPAQLPLIRQWIVMEGEMPPMIDAGTPLMPRETDQFTPIEGANVVRLDGIGLPNAELRFDVNVRGTDVQISQIRIYAGGSAIAIQSPLFVAWDGTTETPDPDNPYDGLPMTFPGGGTETFFQPTGRTVVLSNFPAGGKVSVRFASAI